MAFGIYVHIPYCLQRCTYCDFATVGLKQSLPPQDYYQLLSGELKVRRDLAPTERVSSLYFGGGTPSLVGPDFILAFIKEIQNQGFTLEPDIEITMEINPATMDLHELRRYRQGGVNRFSIGAQTFNEAHLKRTSRLHSVDDTRATFRLLISERANYTFDLLFALPGQTRAQLDRDLDEALNYEPAHVSAYCLTVPDTHPMAQGRAPDDEQVEMFRLLETRLGRAGLNRYEVSNFAKTGFESRHNQIYWTDQPYLGLGLSAHSYLPARGPWGTRFWNASQMPRYQTQVPCALGREGGPQFETLEIHEALTDFAHTSLRLLRGLDLSKSKFPPAVTEQLKNRLEELCARELLEVTPTGYALSAQGRVLTNVVFEALTFLKSELSGVDILAPGLIFT